MKINITKTQRARLVKDWLNDMFSDAEITGFFPDAPANGVYYVKNGKRLVFQDKKNKEFWFDYDTIWSFLESMFSLKYKELQSITEDWLEETLNLRGYTTHYIPYLLHM